MDIIYIGFRHFSIHTNADNATCCGCLDNQIDYAGDTVPLLQLIEAQIDTLAGIGREFVVKKITGRIKQISQTSSIIVLFREHRELSADCNGKTQILLNKICQILSKQFGESHTQRPVRRKAIRVLNALRALPVYSIFEVEKSKGSDEKSVKRKTA